MIKIRAAIYILLFLAICGQGCKDSWDDHYLPDEAQVDRPIWEVIQEEPRFSVFVEEIINQSLDTIFSNEISHTLFIPGNETLQQALDTSSNPSELLLYHISPTLFMSRSVDHPRRLQTLLGKFVLISPGGDGMYFDNTVISRVGPLCMDGKYYEIESPVTPRPNLYEFTARHSPYLREYIDSQDSVYLDLEFSIPIGFDELGNTVYDSVFGVANLFELKYFPITEEFRDENATFVLFTQEQYLSALEQVASDLQYPGEAGDALPKQWQSDVLMPQLLTNAMFEGMLAYVEFMQGEMESITGDTVIVDYQNINPDSKYLCSNGLAYTYSDFRIPDSLYMGAIKIEGEDLLDTLGMKKWTWKDDVVASGLVAEPKEYESSIASDGAMLAVELPMAYEGEYSMEFTIYNVLPLRYRLEWSSGYRPSGLFAVYVNDEKIGEFDSFKFKKSILSVTGELFRPKDNFNRKDFWVENITEYGDVRVRFEYLGPGEASNPHGLTIDYIKLIPEIQGAE
ncbi:MAG: hypothetical protein GY790_17435 [Bacteroidetes bacterium]|nr:hypothetical protein [Bacteroidota bacterium]